jgi:hypothetical protein
VTVRVSRVELRETDGRYFASAASPYGLADAPRVTASCAMTSTPPRPVERKIVDLETKLPEKLLSLASFNSFDDTDSESSGSELEDDEGSDTQPSHDTNSPARPTPAALDAAGRPSSPRQGDCLANGVLPLPRLPVSLSLPTAPSFSAGPTAARRNS